LVRWAFHSSQARAELDRAQQSAHRVQALRTIAAGRLDGAQLDQLVSATDDPLVLLAAFERRWLSGTEMDEDQFVGYAERLSAIARDQRTDPAHAGIVAARLATIFGTRSSR
jgi:hypothetical protein